MRTFLALTVLASGGRYEIHGALSLHRGHGKDFCTNHLDFLYYHLGWGFDLFTSLNMVLMFQVSQGGTTKAWLRIWFYMNPFNFFDRINTSRIWGSWTSFALWSYRPFLGPCPWHILGCWDKLYLCNGNSHDPCIHNWGFVIVSLTSYGHLDHKTGTQNGLGGQLPRTINMVCATGTLLGFCIFFAFVLHYLSCICCCKHCMIALKEFLELEDAIFSNAVFDLMSLWLLKKTCLHSSKLLGIFKQWQGTLLNIVQYLDTAIETFFKSHLSRIILLHNQQMTWVLMLVHLAQHIENSCISLMLDIAEDPLIGHYVLKKHIE